MSFLQRTNLALNRLIDVPYADPDDARKGRLLNILLIGMFILSVFALIVLLVIFSIFSLWNKPGNGLLLITLVGCIIGSLGLFIVNRYQQKTATILFLLLISIGAVFSDLPNELANGRSTYIFLIPIAISSLLLTPASSFFFAIGNSIAIVLLANEAGVVPNIPAIITFFFVALISWLSARSLEQALQELRAINLNLDMLVEQKTEELAATLSREIILAGRNQAILNSIADGVVVFDANSVSILANPALSKIIETPIEDLMGINLADFINTENLSPTSQGKILEMIEHPEKIETGIQVEWGKKTLAISVARVRNAETDQAIGAVAVIRDITREAELEKMKSSFVAVVSHELRTPLNAIMGYAEILKEAVYGTINEKQASATDRIMVNTQRLLAMVGDLLDEAQIKAGKLSLTKQLFKPSSLLEAMHATMDKITTDKGLSLTDEIDLNMPDIITGDARRLQQILINLVSNSAKFTEKGGIHAHILRSDADHWAIEVRDTGTGIPEDEIPYIFEIISTGRKFHHP